MNSKITILVTEKCNNKCYHCDIPTIKSPKNFTVSNLEKVKNLLSNYKNIVITGGEPGILSRNHLDYLFSALPDKVEVNTNGLFIKKGYFMKYYSRISRLQYHPVVELTEEIKVPLIDSKIYYHLPITSKNVTQINDFLIKYPNINFELAMYDSKVPGDQPDYDLIDLSLPNISKHSIEVLRSADNIKNIRKLCSNLCVEPALDLVNGRIKRCVCSHTQADSLPFTDANLRKLKYGNPADLNFNTTNFLCSNCYHCYNLKKELIKTKCKSYS